MKHNKSYLLFFYRKPVRGEIGPVLVKENIESNSKKSASAFGVSVARERGWRFLKVTWA